MIKFIFIVIYLSASSNYQDITTQRVKDLSKEQCELARISTPLGTIDSDGDMIVARTCVQVPSNL
jgi:hypothetical protein